MSTVNSDSSDTDASLSNESETGCTDVLNYTKMYTSATKKCLKLGSAVDKLNSKIETLNSQIKLSAEEALIQCQDFENKKEKYLSKIKSLEYSNYVLEQKYKATLVDLENSKEELSKAFKKLSDFEKGSKNLTELLNSGQKDTRGLGFKSEENISQISRFVKPTNSEFNKKIQKSSQVQNKAHNEYKGLQHSNINKNKQYCYYCDLFGHTTYNCDYMFYNNMYYASWNNGYRNNFGKPKRRPKQKNKSKKKSWNHFSNQNS